MEVLCSEGIANHTGSESCVVHREVQGEALTGETVGQPLSRESFELVQDADAVSVAEGNTDGHVIASARLALRVLEPAMQRRSLFGNREISSPVAPVVPGLILGSSGIRKQAYDESQQSQRNTVAVMGSAGSSCCPDLRRVCPLRRECVLSAWPLCVF